MKELIAIILMAVLAFGIFGCSPKKTDTEKKDDTSSTSPISDRDRQIEEATGE